VFSSVTGSRSAGTATRIVRDVLGLCGGLNIGIVEVRNANTGSSIQLVPFTCGSTVTESLGVDVLVERAAQINRGIAFLVTEIVS
jgi:hypothetical protein